MGFTLLLLTVVVGGAILGIAIGIKWLGVVLGSTVALVFAGFLVSAAARLEPGTTALGWGLVVLIPGAVVAFISGALGHAIFRGRPATNEVEPSPATSRGATTAGSPAEAVDEALAQFEARSQIKARCPKCRELLQVARFENAGATVVACKCNACRREFKAVANES